MRQLYRKPQLGGANSLKQAHFASHFENRASRPHFLKVMLFEFVMEGEKRCEENKVHQKKKKSSLKSLSVLSRDVGTFGHYEYSLCVFTDTKYWYLSYFWYAKFNDKKNKKLIFLSDTD